mmetsp:Transcript_30183/g.91356  ORF Transcript_30183/g.91356 Transcript_30183/m.91356 type:complete len:264 (+) Transcript_30183:400-1191(+)
MRPLEHRLFTEVELRPGVSPIQYKAPLRDAVHWRQQGQPPGFEPRIRLFGCCICCVDTRQLAERAIPIGDRHHTRKPRSALFLGDEAPGHECVHANAALQVRELPAFQGVVVRRARLVQGAAVVRGEHDQRVVPHAFGLQSGNHLANRLVHPQGHRRVQPAVLRVNLLATHGNRSVIDLLKVRLGHLEGRVEQVEGVEQEKRRVRLACVVLPDDSQRPIFEQLLLVASSVRLRVVQASWGCGDTVPHAAAVGGVVHGKVSEAV